MADLRIRAVDQRLPEVQLQRFIFRNCRLPTKQFQNRTTFCETRWWNINQKKRSNKPLNSLQQWSI